MTAAILALILQPSTVAGRFEMGERLRQLDVAWLTTPDKAKRSEAVPKISSATMAFFANRASDACRSLDEAVAALEGRQPRIEDALNFRFTPPVVEPGATARLVVSWAYLPPGATPISVVAGTRSGTIQPGQGLTIELDTPGLNPESARDPEAGVLVPIQAGESRRSAFLSIIKSFDKRLASLRNSDLPAARDLTEPIDRAMSGDAELDIPVIQYLDLGEQLNSRRRTVRDFEQVPYAKQGSTVLRAAVPTSIKSDATVVVAVHGAGGSENMFFEAYGRGMAMQEALKRGWVFLSPRAGSTCIRDSLDWLSRVRGINTARLFVLGHSLGATAALNSGKSNPKPSGIALFAPAASSIPADLQGVPIFLAVGKQESPTLIGMIAGLEKEIVSHSNCQFKEYDPCEHIMVVANGSKDAFSFFDRIK